MRACGSWGWWDPDLYCARAEPVRRKVWTATLVREGNIRNVMARKTESRSKLLDAELKRFIAVASEELDAEKVILFGSFAR